MCTWFTGQANPAPGWRLQWLVPSAWVIYQDFLTLWASTWNTSSPSPSVVTIKLVFLLFSLPTLMNMQVLAFDPVGIVRACRKASRAHTHSEEVHTLMHQHTHIHKCTHACKHTYVQTNWICLSWKKSGSCYPLPDPAGITRPDLVIIKYTIPSSD